MIDFTMIVPLINEVILSMEVDGITDINYQPGNKDQIISEIIEFNNSKTKKGKKYPLFALQTPITIEPVVGSNYKLVTIPGLTIATDTQQNIPVLDRFLDGGTFKTILYPCMIEFLTKLCWHELVVTNEPANIVQTCLEAPGVEPIDQTTDFVDCLHLKNLQFLITITSKC